MREPASMPPPPDSLARGYESDALRMRPVLWFLFFFVLSNVLIFVGVRIYMANTVHGQNAAFPLQSLTVSHAPPEPQLQLTPAHPSSEAQDLQSLRAQQESRLHSAAPLPGDPAHARIPIDRAMELYAKEQHP